VLYKDFMSRYRPPPAACVPLPGWLAAPRHRSENLPVATAWGSVI